MAGIVAAPPLTSSGVVDTDVDTVEVAAAALWGWSIDGSAIATFYDGTDTGGVLLASLVPAGTIVLPVSLSVLSGSIYVHISGSGNVVTYWSS